MSAKQTSKSSAKLNIEHDLDIGKVNNSPSHAQTSRSYSSYKKNGSARANRNSLVSSSKTNTLPLGKSNTKADGQKAMKEVPKKACFPDFKTRRFTRPRVANEAYLRNKVKTASGGELVIMLYEKAISNLSIACELLEQDNTTPDSLLETGKNIRNAKEIILELLYSLDLETGGEFARKMSGIYGFMNRELTEALIEKSSLRLKPIIEQLKILLEAWKKAHEQLKSQEKLEHPNKGDLQIGP